MILSKPKRGPSAATYWPFKEQLGLPLDNQPAGQGAGGMAGKQRAARLAASAQPLPSRGQQHASFPPALTGGESHPNTTL